MEVFITGGAGFLGYHLANYLNSKNYEVSICDIAPINEEDYSSSIAYYQIDVRDQDGINQLISKADFVIHAAAALPLWKREDIIETNVIGTRNVLDSSLNNKIKRVIFISSTAVYGIPRKHPILEDDTLAGIGPYGESKISAEKICLNYIAKGLNVTIIRPKTFLGPGRLGVFQILYDWVRSGKRIPMIGNGRNHYQLLAVEDLVEVIYNILKINYNNTNLNNIFNIGAEEFGTVAEDVGALCRFAASGSKVLTIPAFYAKLLLKILETMKLSPLYKWVYETADKESFVSTDKAKSIIGYRPKFSNKDALINSYRWYLNNLENLKDKTGISHRVGWKQGALNIIKRIM